MNIHSNHISPQSSPSLEMGQAREMNPASTETIIEIPPVELKNSELEIFEKLEKNIKTEMGSIEENTLIKVGSLRIAKYWGADEDEDEDGDDGKKRMPLGARENAIFVAALVTIFTLSGYLGSKEGQSVFASSIAAPSMDVVKKYYNNIKDTQFLRYTMIVLSSLALAGSVSLPYSIPDEKKGHILYRIATAIPWSYPAFGIIKATLSSNNVTEFFRCKHINQCTLSPTQAKAFSAITQIIVIVGLQIGLFKANISDPSFGAACGIFYKPNARALTNIGGEEISKLEHRTVRVLTGGVATLMIVAATAAGYAGNSLNWFDSFQGLLIGYLLIAVSDIFVRTIKQSIRIKVNEVNNIGKIREKINKLRGLLDESCQKESTLQQRALEGTKKVGFGLLNCVVPVAAAFGLGAMNPDPNIINNAGLIASLTQDATALCKLPTKMLPLKSVLAASGLAVGLGVTAYTVKELPNLILATQMSNVTLETPTSNATQATPLFDWPCYSATIALACIATSFAAYHVRRLIRPPKIKDVTEKKELKLAKKEAKEKKLNRSSELLETTPLLNKVS